MIKEVKEAKSMMSDGYSLKVKAGGLWYLERDKSKAQRVHKNIIRVLRSEGRASFDAPQKIEEGPLFSVPRNKARGTPTSSAQACVDYLLANGVTYAKKKPSVYIDYFNIQVSKADEKLASRLLFGSSMQEWERWAAIERRKAKNRERRKARATAPVKKRAVKKAAQKRRAG